MAAREIRENSESGKINRLQNIWSARQIAEEAAEMPQKAADENDMGRYRASDSNSEYSRIRKSSNVENRWVEAPVKYGENGRRGASSKTKTEIIQE